MNVFNVVLGTIVLSLSMALIAVAGMIPDNSKDNITLAEIETARKQAQAEKRYQLALKTICGVQSAWQVNAKGDIQCFDKNGNKTSAVLQSK